MIHRNSSILLQVVFEKSDYLNRIREICVRLSKIKNRSSLLKKLWDVLFIAALNNEKNT